MVVSRHDHLSMRASLASLEYKENIIMPLSNASSIVIEAMRRIAADRARREWHIINGVHAFDHILNNLNKYDWLLEHLEDVESRDLLAWLMGNRIGFYLAQSKEQALEVFPAQMAPVQWRELTARASVHDANRLENNLPVDVVENWILDGYSLLGECEVSPGDIVLDCGAFNGNSSIVLANKAGPTGLVYAFEPNPEMIPVLGRNFLATDCNNVEVVQAALSEQSGSFRFSKGGAGSRLSEDGGVEVAVTTIDQFVEERKLDRVDFIKFDIEGFELPALKGAAQTIQRFRPKLAISVYHLHYDITDIPLYIKGICPWYRLFLRHNAPYDGEMVLFLRPSGRVAGR